METCLGGEVALFEDVGEGTVSQDLELPIEDEADFWVGFSLCVIMCGLFGQRRKCNACRWLSDSWRTARMGKNALK